jgi:hypothetical protein
LEAVLDGRLCRTEAGFFDAVAAALEFPAYFGRNWDAFHECLGDLLDLTEGGMGHEFGDRDGRAEHALHLRVLHAEHLLAEADRRGLRVLLELLRWPYLTYGPQQPERRHAGRCVTLVWDPEALDTFTARLQAAGLRPEDVRPAP